MKTNIEENKKNYSIKIRNVIYIVLGFLSFAVGSIGIILPILPTVPFYMLTAFFFAKGSPKFHNWFLATKVYQNYCFSFAKHRTMSIGGVLFLMGFVSSVLITTLYFTNSLAMTIVILLMLFLKYTYFITSVNIVSKKELLKLNLEVKCCD